MKSNLDLIDSLKEIAKSDFLDDDQKADLLLAAKKYLMLVPRKQIVSRNNRINSVKTKRYYNGLS